MNESTLQGDEEEEEKLRHMERDIDDFLFSIREKVSSTPDIENEDTYSEVHDDYDIIASNDGRRDEEEEEKLRCMERDIDDFLFSIRENTSRSPDMENEGTYSEVQDDYDIASDDSFEEESLPSRSDGPTIPYHAGKLPYRSFKNKQKRGKWNMKNYRKSKQWSKCHHEAWHRRGDGEFGQSSKDEYHHQEESFHPRWRDESISPRNEECHQERSHFPKSDYDQGRSFSASGSNEHQGVSGVFPSRRVNHHQQRDIIPRRRGGYKRGSFYPIQDSYDFEEKKYAHERSVSVMSESSDYDNVSHRQLSRWSNSPIDWSESYEYDCDYEDEDSNQPWSSEENHSYMKEDRNDQDAMSLITVFLQRVITHNPEIASKVRKACMTLIDKPDGPAESDHEYNRDSWAAYEEESGRVSPQSWRGSRSPSFTESLGASSSRSGYSRHTERFYGHSKRSVLERSLSPDVREGERDKYKNLDRRKKMRYSPDYKRHNDTRSSTAASPKQRPRKRSSSEHSRTHHEEDFNLEDAVSWSIRKIKKQCKKEENSLVRRALLSLLEVHERECKMYMKKPVAHPDYKKEYREFVDQKTKSIVDLGGDPYGYDFEQDWRKHWPVQMYKIFHESWNTKMHSCTSLLQKKCNSGSRSSLSVPRKSTAKQPPKEKQRKHQRGSEDEAVNAEGSIKKATTSVSVGKFSEVTDSSLVAQQSTERSSTMLHKELEMNCEIFSILKLLNHIKHRFNDCEASFDKLYVKVMSLKEDSVAINDILQGDLPLLEKIDKNLKQTVEDVSLTLIQKAVIQETHERFISFLKKNKEMNSHSKKSKQINTKKSVENIGTCMEDTKAEHQIPCHLTQSHSSVASSKCGTIQEVSQPIRTLTEISLWGSSGTQSKEIYIPENTSEASLPCMSRDGIPLNREFTPDVMSVGKHANCQRRTLTEISLVGSSCPASSGTHKCNRIIASKESDLIQPPPPGVTPPPPGVTPPPPGVTPPPRGVTPPSPGVTPPDVTPPSSGAALPSPGVTPPPSGVAPLCGGALPSPSVEPLSAIGSSNNVTKPPCRVSAPLHSVKTSSLSVAAVPRYVIPPSAVTPPPHSITSQPSSSTSDVAQKSLGITPTTTVSSVSTVLHTPISGTSSPPPAASVLESQSATDRTYKAPQHRSAVITSSEESCEPSENKLMEKDTIIDIPILPSKELLRSTIKDCFLSSSLPEGSSDNMSTKEEVLRIGTSAEESSVTSVPSLPEDVLKMFEIKPVNNDKVNADEKGPAKTDTINNKTAKKPIKITIPQFSKQRKNMPELNPLTYDQELL